ncbi:transporter substrate-binding domain-containing protein [Deltaproteobacteria bacterium TL4]
MKQSIGFFESVKVLRRTLVIMLMALIVPTMGVAKVINVCTDENTWYPFTYAEEGKSVGVHVDVVDQALKNLGHTPQFKPVPWARCLDDAERGRVDAVVSSSYKEDRAAFAYYPTDAKTAQKSKWRVTQAEYVIVTYKEDPYVYKGDVSTLPKPVRVPKGYSIIADLEKLGIAVDAAKGDQNNFAKLIRDKKGVVITLPGSAELFNKSESFKGMLKVSEQPYTSKSYYMIFSKQSKLTEAERQAIWDEIVKVRENEDVYSKIISKY